VSLTGCSECGQAGELQTAAFITGLGLTFFGYIWSIFDAPASANDINARSRQNSELTIFNSDDNRFSLNVNSVPITKSYTISLSVNF
jgi:predicted ATP-grasp superfamily ATP-dependent carboligase